MSKVICGECHLPFDGDYFYHKTDKDGGYWVCPHCNTVSQEPEA